MTAIATTDIQAQINEVEAQIANSKGIVKVNYMKKRDKLVAQLPQVEVTPEPEVAEVEAPASDSPRRGRPRKYIDAFYAEVERQSREGRGRRSLTQLLMDCEKWNVTGVDLEGDYRAIELALVAAQTAALDALRIERPKSDTTRPASKGTRTHRPGGKLDGRSRSVRHSRAVAASVFGL